jgi:hypothetical protein
MFRTTTIALLCGLAGLAAGLHAQGDPDPKERAPAGPGAEHRWLAEDAGTWAIAAKIFAPGVAEPIEVEGTSTMEMLWGRYLREEFVVGEGARAMRGTGLLGYDVEAGTFRAVYCVNTGTSISISTGSRSAGGSALTFVEMQAGANAGEPKHTARTVITRIDGKRRVERFTRIGDEPERKSFEMTYTRK